MIPDGNGSILVLNAINTWCSDGYTDGYDDMWSSGGDGSYCNEHTGGLLAGADGIDTISNNKVL